MPLPQQPVYGSSLASISPQVPVSQVGSWPLVLLPLYFFQETKFVKSILSDSGIRTTFSSFCLSTGNYMACSVWSNLIVLPFAHSTQSVSSGWVFCFCFYTFFVLNTTKQRYWLVGGVIWIVERILREIRSRHITYISKVIQHPSNVMELQIKKEKTTTRAGQYIFLSCPEVSYFQWHPFTLTR